MSSELNLSWRSLEAMAPEVSQYSSSCRLVMHHLGNRGNYRGACKAQCLTRRLCYLYLRGDHAEIRKVVVSIRTHSRRRGIWLPMELGRHRYTEVAAMV